MQGFYRNRDEDNRKIKIRAAKPPDLQRLVALHKDMYIGEAGLAKGLPFILDEKELRKMLYAQIRSKNCLVLVLEYSGQIMAFLVCSIVAMERRWKMDGELGYVGDIYVRPEIRRTKAASSLLDIAEKWLRGNGVTYVQCNVLVRNAAGRAFWSSQGYGETLSVFCKSL